MFKSAMQDISGCVVDINIDVVLSLCIQIKKLIQHKLFIKAPEWVLLVLIDPVGLVKIKKLLNWNAIFDCQWHSDRPCVNFVLGGELTMSVYNCTEACAS